MYTHDIRRYLGRLAIFAVISQPFYVLAFHPREFWENLTNWNIFITLFFSLLAIYGIKSRKWWWFVVGVLAINLLNADYANTGVILTLIFYLCRNKPWLGALIYVLSTSAPCGAGAWRTLWPWWWAATPWALRSSPSWLRPLSSCPPMWSPRSPNGSSTPSTRATCSSSSWCGRFQGCDRKTNSRSPLDCGCFVPHPPQCAHWGTYPYPLCPFGTFPPDRGSRPLKGKAGGRPSKAFPFRGRTIPPIRGKCPEGTKGVGGHSRRL